MKGFISNLVLNLLLPAGLRYAQPCRYCFYSEVPINVKFGAGERTAGPLPRAVLSGGKRGNTAPKLSKFRILAVNLPLRDDLFAIFYDILSVCTRL